MTEKYANTMIMSEPYAAHAAPITRVWGMIRAASPMPGTSFAPPQVVGFKRVTTTHIILFSRLSSKHIPSMRIFTAEQLTQRADSARRGVSPRSPPVNPSITRLKITLGDNDDKTGFCTFNFKLMFFAVKQSNRRCYYGDG